ncbi:MAG TPA: hypothetical protein VG733_00055 [Chthoniobacteraceae bacterium]|nr:hypothetical protein [Chthoniobacteraceae bacterium]
MKTNTLSNIRISLIIIALLILLCSIGRADDSSKNSADTQDTRYGPFNLFDHRSGYGQGVFPEPFLVDDSDLEVNEFRLDWLHTNASSQHTDLFTAEIEKGFGLLTLEIEVPFERDAGPGGKTMGFDNIDFGARVPFYQYVSRSGFIDSTFGVGIEVGVPTNSPVSKNTEAVPKVFNDLRLGNHFTLQSIFGFSQLYGSGDDGGIQTFEYGFVFGYTIDHKELPLPHVQQLIPVFEVDGARQLNKDGAGSDSILGNAALRFNLDAIGPVQPRLGFGVVFPMDNGAREDVHWGLYTSLVFEY